MAQFFKPSANVIVRYGIVGIPALFLLLIAVRVRVDWSPWKSQREDYVDQPVPFSHAHHVGGLGIDCRYCHASVEMSSTAGMPATHTCMSCHSQIWTEADVLAPVRMSLQRQQPIQWNRVYKLPDYVYFNHSIHVNHGVGCETCHGRVDRMPLTYKANSLYMAWCLRCHRQPERFLRPRDQIYTFGYTLPAKQQLAVGRRLVKEYGVQVHQLTNCSVCHR